jgi:sulfite oxidase
MLSHQVEHKEDVNHIICSYDEILGSLLIKSWITPKEFWFVRNHHPVPVTSEVKDENYFITVTIPRIGDRDERVVEYSLKDIKTKFPKHKVISTLQCGGNRRHELSQVRSRRLNNYDSNDSGFGQIERTLGSPWGFGAMATAEWAGARLADVFEDAGLSNEDMETLEREIELKYQSSRNDEEDIHPCPSAHVQFTSLDGMQASVPSTKALSRKGDTILGKPVGRYNHYHCAYDIDLAYEFNNEDIPTQHGYPLRAIVPGHVGVRNVKWLDSGEK